MGRGKIIEEIKSGTDVKKLKITAKIIYYIAEKYISPKISLTRATKVINIKIIRSLSDMIRFIVNNHV